MIRNGILGVMVLLALVLLALQGAPRTERPPVPDQGPAPHPPSRLKDVPSPPEEDDLPPALPMYSQPAVRLDVTVVAREDGKPLPGMTVYVMSHDHGASGPKWHMIRQTDAEGRVTVKVPVDGARVHAWGEGRVSTTHPKTAAGREPAEVKLALQLTSAIRGTVTDSATRQPVEGVVVTFGDGERTRTDAEGLFLAEGLDPDVTLKLSAEGYVAITRKIHGLAPGEVTGRQFALPPAMTVKASHQRASA